MGQACVSVLTLPVKEKVATSWSCLSGALSAGRAGDSWRKSRRSRCMAWRAQVTSPGRLTVITGSHLLLLWFPIF